VGSCCSPKPRRLGIAERLARAIPDGRDPDRITQLLPDILRARIFAIACGYEDADDLDRLRFDPAFKLACGRLPASDRNLCSQPTVSRWENAPNLRDLTRLMGVMVDLYWTIHVRLHRLGLRSRPASGVATRRHRDDSARPPSGSFFRHQPPSGGLQRP
jgi:hypothetical protein